MRSAVMVCIQIYLARMPLRDEGSWAVQDTRDWVQCVEALSADDVMDHHRGMLHPQRSALKRKWPATEHLDAGKDLFCDTDLVVVELALCVEHEFLFV